MNAAPNSECETSGPDAILLSLFFDGRSCTFELPANETRAITVGSLPSTDLRIPGVAPVQFHIEREGNQLWIVPAYGPETLRVDTARVTGPRLISSRAVIEFCGVRVEATVLDTAASPRRRSPSARLRQSGFTEHEQHSPSQVFSQGELGVSHSAWPVRTVAGMRAPTVAIERAATPPAAVEQPTTRLSPLIAASIEPLQRTAIIERVRVVPLTSESNKAPITLRTDEAPTIVFRPILPIERSSDVGADRIGSSPLRLDAPESVRKKPASARGAGYPAQRDSQQTTHFEPIRISQAPVDGIAANERLTASADQLSYLAQPVQATVLTQCLEPSLIIRWLSEVGRFSMRRPLIVWIVATLAAFALSATITKLSKSEKPASHTARRQSALTVPSSPSVASSASPAPAQSPDPPALFIISAESTPSSAKPKKGQAARPALVSAVDALISGHYADAHAAYARLSAEAPENLALRTTAALLAKKLAPQCSSTPRSRSGSCPETKP